MALSPIDVQQKTFVMALRGYDVDEVDDFLDEVVLALKDYDQRLRDAQERIATLEVEMNDRGEAEGAISRALLAAQRSADSIVDEARVDAERIVAEARTQASEMSAQRDAETESARQAIESVRAAVGELRTRVAELSGGLIDHLDSMEQAAEAATAQVDAVAADPAPSENQWTSPESAAEVEADEEPARETDEIPALGDDGWPPEAPADEPITIETDDDAVDIGAGSDEPRVTRPWETG